MAAPRRAPYRECFVKDLSVDAGRVCVAGMIIGTAAGSFLLDDGTAQISVIAAEQPPSSYVRVFGTVILVESGMGIQADLVQDFSRADKHLYQQLKKILTNEAP